MALRPSQRRSRKSREEVRINMVPVMNLFIVIIPLLITMWAVVQLTVLQIDFTKSGQAGTTEQEGNGEDGGNLPIVSLGIFKDKFELKVDQNEELYDIPHLDEKLPNSYDFSLLDEKLEELSDKYSEQQTIQIYAANEVDYGILIKTMDICKYRGFVNVAYMTAKTYLYRTK